MSLQPHQLRVCTEYTELSENIQKLCTFMGTPVWQGMTFIEQELLREQLTHMSGYQRVLRMRLSLWHVEPDEIGALVLKGAPNGSQEG
jgi:hypothetical protein